MCRFHTIFSVLVLVLTHSQAETVDKSETHTETETTNYGPVTMVLNNLAQITLNVSDESSVQLESKMERTAQDIAGNMEVLTSQAMAQLSDAIYDTNQLLVANPACNPAWNLEEFTANITDQLSACTLSLSSIIDTFRRDGQQAVANVQGFVQQIAQLPSRCQLMGESSDLITLSLGFAGGSNCFIQGMADINKGMAQAMHNASLLLVRTRSMSQEQVALAQECSESVVSDILAYLREEQANCG